jgi:hypothetical protein
MEKNNALQRAGDLGLRTHDDVGPVAPKSYNKCYIWGACGKVYIFHVRHYGYGLSNITGFSPESTL